MDRNATYRTTTVVITYRRDDALRQTLARLGELLANSPDHEVVLVDNNEDDFDRSGLLVGFAYSAYVRSNGNIGVAGGRNLGAAAASGEVLIFIDDDALILGNPGFHDEVFRLFNRDTGLGAVAFRSHLRELGVSDPIEFPHTDKSLPRDRPFETFRFIGVGHAIRASAFEEVGPYFDSFFYGMEEFELCFRLMDKGWTIRYEPEFAVMHMKLPSGRLPSTTVARRMYANKLCLAWMHLPMREFLLCAGAWAVKTTLDTRNPLTVLRSWTAFTKIAVSGGMKRQPKPHVVNRIAQLGGIPWR